MEQVLKDNKSYLRLITAFSIAIPIVVAILLFMPFKIGSGEMAWIKMLPSLNAVLNSSTAIILLLALWAVKSNRIQLHKNLMFSALTLGTLFLISYVIYHSSAISVKFGDADHNGVLSEAERLAVGGMRTVYLIVLLSHIALSIVVVPFVLLAFYRALTGNITKHKKIVKFTFPIWLYVSITGVIVYLLISPYY